MGVHNARRPRALWWSQSVQEVYNGWLWVYPHSTFLWPCKLAEGRHYPYRWGESLPVVSTSIKAVIADLGCHCSMDFLGSRSVLDSSRTSLPTRTCTGRAGLPQVGGCLCLCAFSSSSTFASSCIRFVWPQCGISLPFHPHCIVMFLTMGFISLCPVSPFSSHWIHPIAC